LEKEASEDLEALDEALTKLVAEDQDKAEPVKLHFFAGLTKPEIARVLKISLVTAERHWTYARTWFYAELKKPRQFRKILRILKKGMRGFARICRIEDSRVIALS
jgi:DNA-directed RNA polymerase specialized sigma24 family protein